MRFLIKVAFWLAIVVMLLPTGAKHATAPTPEVGTTEAVSAASAAMSDMRRFCARQPEACAIGSQAAVAFGQKAQAGAKMLYEFLNDKLGANETGSVAMPAGRPAGASSQHTLTPGDLNPAWRGPEPRKDPKRQS